MKRLGSLISLALSASLGCGFHLLVWRLCKPGAPASQPTTFGPKRGANRRAESRGGRLCYYRNPMGAPDTSPVPKKDPMGMDYIPVYADERRPTPAPSR